MDEVDKKPWRKQRPFKRDASIIYSPEDVCLLVEEHPGVIGALIGLIYLGGCRISELVKYDKLQFDCEEREINGKKRKVRIWKTRRIIEQYPSIKKRQIQFIEEEGIPIMLMTVRNLKNRMRHTKDIPVNLSKLDNSRIVQVIKDYINNKNPDEELFDFGIFSAEYKLKKILPFNIHFLRDLRATHLSVRNDMKEGELTRVMGWTDNRPSTRYVQLKWRDLIKKT